MNRHLVHNPGPHIVTATTERLLDQLDGLARREPTVEPAVRRVRGGDGEILLDLIRRVQSGDDDAGVITLGALLPHLCKITLNRYPRSRWGTVIDEYVTLAYLTIRDVTADEPPARLFDKVLSRTRRRYDRQFETVTAAMTTIADLDRTPVETRVEEQAIARHELATVSRAVRTGWITSRQWNRVRAAASDQLDGPMTAVERQQLARARRRLATIRELEAAA